MGHITYSITLLYKRIQTFFWAKHIHFWDKKLFYSGEFVTNSQLLSIIRIAKHSQKLHWQAAMFYIVDLLRLDFHHWISTIKWSLNSYETKPMLLNQLFTTPGGPYFGWDKFGLTTWNDRCNFSLSRLTGFNSIGIMISQIFSRLGTFCLPCTCIHT